MPASFKRLLQFVALLWLCLTLVFVALVAMRGNPVSLYLDPRLSPAEQASLAHQYGYDLPPLQQYGRYCLALLRGDLGISFLMKRPVAEVLPARLATSTLLGATALLAGLVLAFLLLLLLHHPRLGRLAGLGQGLLTMMLSLPPFVLASLAMALLAVRWRLFPVAGTESLFAEHLSPIARLLDRGRHLVLPALSLALPLAAQFTAYLHERLRLLEDAPFVIGARGRGVADARIFWNHKLRVLLPALVQLLGLYLPALVAGTLVIESIFGWSGMGLLLLDAMLARDYPLLLGASLLVMTFSLCCYQLADGLREALARKGYAL